MKATAKAPDRIALAPDLEISRIVTGLWQVADMERGGQLLDPEVASSAMLDYARAGFDSFDMADHYGSAEIITGRFLARVAAGAPAGANRPSVFTKWCPPPGPMTPEIVRAGVERSLRRLGVSTIDLLQFHWWTFEHPGYLDAMKELAKLREEGVIRHLGVTNFDTAHLRVPGEARRPDRRQSGLFLVARSARGGRDERVLRRAWREIACLWNAGRRPDLRALARHASEPSANAIADWSKMEIPAFCRCHRRLAGLAGHTRRARSHRAPP